MKRYIKTLSVAGLSAAAMLLAACNSDDPDFSYWLDGDEEIEDPSGTDPDAPKQEPVYDFQTMSKNVKIDPSVQYQTLEGIGASDCWLPATLGQYWSNKDKMAELLFSQEIRGGQPQGIGLSMWRVNLGAGTEELGENSGIDEDNKYNRAPSYVNGTAGNLTYDWNKCPGQRYFMQRAKECGVEKFVLFSNSPLVQFTKNGKGKSNAGANANIKDEYYDDFADYMATVAQHFVNEGYDISHISPVNEPQYNWNGTNQEGSGWKNEQVARIARELQSALDSKNISTKISLGEAGAWDCLYEGENSRHNVLENFYTQGNSAYIGDLSRVDNICAHSYYTDGSWNGMIDARRKAAAAAAKYGAKLWQTEWSLLVVGTSHYVDKIEESDPWTIAQWMASVIHNDFVECNVTSWSYWTAMSVERWGQMDRFMLLNCVPTGGNYSNDFTTGGTVEDFPTLWVLGNYSRFVRPGFKRINLEMIDSEKFFGDAWISPDGKQIVCVYTNRQPERGVKVKVNYGAWPSAPASIWRYTTTLTKKLEGNECDPDFPVVCEPSSVTTIVYNLQ